MRYIVYIRMDGDPEPGLVLMTTDGTREGGATLFDNPTHAEDCISALSIQAAVIVPLPDRIS